MFWHRALFLSSCLAFATPAFAAFTAANQTVRLTVDSVSLAARYGSTTASAGRQFAVLTTTWENRIDPALADKRGLAPGYGVDNLPQHLFLIVDASNLGVLRGGLARNGGGESLSQFTVATPGKKAAGDVVFEIPAGKPASLDLRFYDDVGGDFALALGGSTSPPKPIHAAQKNAVGEFAVFGFEDPAPGVHAPAGFRAVAVDLRARSTWLAEKDAPAYDPAVEPGTKVSRVNLLDWPEVATYLHVLADGTRSCAAMEGALPDSLRFIPEFFTGSHAVFLVPADAHRLELFCAMPHASTDDGVLNLAPLRFPLVDVPAGPSPPAGALKITDDMFQIAVGARRVAQFAGESAGDGQIFIIVDVDVVNHGESGEFFQPAEQMRVLDSGGGENGPDGVTSRGPHRPEGDKVHLPPGEERRFELIYRVEAALEPVRLSFHGGSFAQTYDLPAESPATP